MRWQAADEDSEVSVKPISVISTLSDEEQALLEVVSDFVEQGVRPVVHQLEHDNVYPHALIETMKSIGIFGLCVPEAYGGFPVSTPCYGLVTEEIARGWMSLAGAFGGHSVICRVLAEFGTEEQKRRYLPRMASGELRVAMALTEAGGGSDLQAMRTVARRQGDGYVVNGSKTWITNARRAGLIGLLCKTDPTADPPHKGMSVLLVEKGPGVGVSGDLPKLGYKGVESCEIVFDDCPVGLDAVVGGIEGQGFAQMMRGLELGRIQVAARAVGVAHAAYDDAMSYAQQRETFGQPIWQHQSIANYLADMATRLHAARLLVLDAGRVLDTGMRADIEAAMAKVFASEACMETALDAVRIHGGHGYSTEFDVERFFRDAPLMIVGEGTNEIQRQVITKQLVRISRRGGH